MSRSLSDFTPIAQRPNLSSAQKGALRCTALRLRDGSLCLYSPVLGLTEAVRNGLVAMGKVSVLLAPNHYHHKGLSEYAEAFPNAELLCSDSARARLEQQTGLTFGSLSTLDSQLPKDCQCVEPNGLKTGEVWLTLKTPEDLIWILCDAFKGPAASRDTPATQVELLGTFPSYGIKDKAAYIAWLEAICAKMPPTVIVPCHGAIVRSDTLAFDVQTLMQ